MPDGNDTVTLIDKPENVEMFYIDVVGDSSRGTGAIDGLVCLGISFKVKEGSKSVAITHDVAERIHAGLEEFLSKR
jgi:hypothetical protein